MLLKCIQVFDSEYHNSILFRTDDRTFSGMSKNERAPASKQCNSKHTYIISVIVIFAKVPSLKSAYYYFLLLCT